MDGGYPSKSPAGFLISPAFTGQEITAEQVKPPEPRIVKRRGVVNIEKIFPLERQRSGDIRQFRIDNVYTVWTEGAGVDEPVIRKECFRARLDLHLSATVDISPDLVRER